MLHRLVENNAENLLPESRRYRSTMHMVFTARQPQDRCIEQHQDLFIAFIDLSKTFDTATRELL